jgi:hypothetical protein
MDDFFGWEFSDDLVSFCGHLRPCRQVLLLLFWESIRCPFEDKKQDDGACLKIIGFWVDVNQGTITLPPSSVGDILSKISDFIHTPTRRPPLREWQRLAGHLNWLLNVLPWGRPALTELYRKISGKTQPNRGIFINAEVRRDLEWLASIIPQAIGVRFIDNGLWDDLEADMVIWSDASLKLGISFVFAGNGFIYQILPCADKPKINILFLELVGILSGIHHIVSLPHPPRRLLCYTDSLDAVRIFNSLRASESLHNGPLLAVAGIILRTNIDLRVRHIEGKANIRADLLSRLLLDDYTHQFPADRVRSFSPLRDLLPARWRESF